MGQRAKAATTPYPLGVFNTHREFEPGWVEYASVAAARMDSSWVESNIIKCGIAEAPDWVFTILYSDGSILPIRLSLMSGKPLVGTTIFRRHKQSGRVVPLIVAADDPGLKDTSLDRLSYQQALMKLAKPRFDPEITPTLMNYVNNEITIMMGTGIAKVAELQAISLLAAEMVVGWVRTGAAVRSVSTGVRVGALVDEEALAAKLLQDTSDISSPFRQLLECARRLGAMRLAPQRAAAVLEKVCDLMGYEYIRVDQGARILLLAKNLSSGLEITAQGIRLGKVSQAAMDLVDCTTIRPITGP